MAGQEPTGQDFLQREVQESQDFQGSHKNKSETLKILEQAAQICDKFGNSEKATEIRKDCEDVRIATIAALKGVLGETSGKLAEMKYELDGPSVETLSDGTIDDNELAQIKEELGDLKKYKSSSENINTGKVDTSMLEAKKSYDALKILKYQPNVRNPEHIASLFDVEKTKTTIKMISDKNDVLYIIKNHPDKMRNIDISELHPNLLDDPNFINNFPGTFNDISFIPFDTLISKGILTKFIQAGRMKDLLPLLLADKNRGYTALYEVLKDLGLTPEQKEELKSVLPASFMQFDSNFIIFSALEVSNYLAPTLSTFKGIHKALQKDGVSNTEKDKLYKGINDYIEQNKISNDIRNLFIELVNQDGLRFINSLTVDMITDPGNESLVDVICSDPESLKMLPKNIRQTKAIHTRVANNVLNNSTDGVNYIKYIQIGSVRAGLALLKHLETTKGINGGKRDQEPKRFHLLKKEITNQIIPLIDPEKITQFIHLDEKEKQQLTHVLKSRELMLHSIQNIDKTQEVIKHTPSSIIFARNFLESQYPGKSEEIEPILESLQKGLIAHEIAPLIRQLLISNGGVKLNPEMINSFTLRLFSEVRDGAQIDKHRTGLVGHKNIGTLPPTIFEKGEDNLFYLISTGSNKDNPLIKLFIESEYKDFDQFLKAHKIDPTSKLGKSIITLLQSDKIAVEAHGVTQQNSPLGKEMRKALQTGNFTGLQELQNQLKKDYKDGNIDTSGMKDGGEILKEKGITIDDDGSLIFPEEAQEKNMQVPLSPNTISSPDIKDQYRGISYELNLTKEESQSLTIEELEMIAGDEKIRESFVGFRDTLVELGLTEVWKFRNQIFKAIGSLDFSLTDGDYMGENEMMLFLSKTVYASTQYGPLKEPQSNLDATKQMIRSLNHQDGGPSDIDSVTSVGESLTVVEKNFVDRFAPRDEGLVGFKFAEFKNALRGNPSFNPQ